MVLGIALLGCRPPPPSDEPTGETGETPASPVRCELAPDNALRGRCHVALDDPAAIEITYGPSDASGALRAVRSASSLEHTVTLPILPPETDIQWSVRTLGGDGSWSGRFETTALPPDVRMEAAVKGTATAGLVGFASPCLSGPVAFIADAQTGAPLWYHTFARGGSLHAVTFTDRQTVLALSYQGLHEVDLAGRTLVDIPASSLPHELHHDVLRHDEHLYVLYKREIMLESQVFLLDGFLVLEDDGTIVADWFLGDHHTPTAPPLPADSIDYSHANSLFIDDDGDVVISFRHLSSVVEVAGPSQPDFGVVRWVWAGRDDAPLGSDIETENRTGGPDGFAMQHHVHRLPDGRWAMFDNRDVGLESSRLLIASLDEGAGTAVLEEAYDVGTHCPFQGAAHLTAAGNPVATCAPYRTALEFTRGTQGPDGGADEAQWTFTATCDNINLPLVPRFAPLEW